MGKEEAAWHASHHHYSLKKAHVVQRRMSAVRGRYGVLGGAGA